MSVNVKIQTARPARRLSIGRLAGPAGVIPALIVAQGCAFSSRADLTGSSSQASSTASTAYIGCYADGTARDLPYEAYTGSSTASAPACIAACTNAGYKYAGSQDGNQCFCGNSYGSQGTSSNCTLTCAGNSSEKCGGAWANSVYSTGYLGCYADSSTRDLPDEAYTGNSTATIQACVSACASAGYLYAGSQDGNQCFCGNSYGSQGTSSNCTMTCAGNSSEKCGGAWASSVYSTALSSVGGSSSGGGTCAGGTAQSSDIQIEVSSLEQHITGFGVSSAWSSSYLNSSDPEYLWSTTNGAGLSLLRIRYGDGLGIAQGAVSYGVTVWMTPWGTGPGGSQGGPDTTTENDPNGCTNGTMPVLTNPSGWASSLSTWVQNAKSQGVTLYAVSAENEPDSCGINTTTSYSPSELATWIANYLGPAMHAIGVKVMGPETQNVCGFGNQSSGYFGAIYSNTTAYNYLDIAATHQYGCSDPPMQGQNGFPNLNAAGKEYWETETTLGPSDDTIDSGIVIAQTMQSDLTQSNVNAWHYWWMYSGPPAGLYDTNTNQWSKRLWAMGNYSRFVRPGFNRIDTAGTPPSGVALSAYTNTLNGQVVIVVINSNNSATPLSLYFPGNNVPCSLTPYETSANDNLTQLSNVSVSGSRVSVTLDPMSIVTFAGTP